MSPASGLAHFAEQFRLFQLRPGDALPGGEFAGIVYDKGVPSILVLGPEHESELTWPDATAWAKSLNVEGCTDFFLPLRPHGWVLKANLGDRFRPKWYWLGEQHASDSNCAYGQTFNNGTQDGWHKLIKFRARAVRCLALQPFIHLSDSTAREAA